MKTLKEYEEEASKIFDECGDPYEMGDIPERVMSLYRQAIKEILEEVVGEDKVKGQIEGYLADEMYFLEDGYNQAKAEIRANAAKLLGE